MLVPVLIFFVCFVAGVMSAARWLPDLAPGPIGGLAFFTVVINELTRVARVGRRSTSRGDTISHVMTVHTSTIRQAVYSVLTRDTAE